MFKFGFLSNSFFVSLAGRVVSEEDYQLWLEEAKIKFAKEDILENNKLIASNK